MCGSHASEGTAFKSSVVCPLLSSNISAFAGLSVTPCSRGGAILLRLRFLFLVQDYLNISLKRICVAGVAGERGENAVPMKKIEAIIKPFRLEDVKTALNQPRSRRNDADGGQGLRTPTGAILKSTRVANIRRIFCQSSKIDLVVAGCPGRSRGSTLSCSFGQDREDW